MFKSLKHTLQIKLRLKGQAVKDFLPCIDRFSSLEQLLVVITQKYSDDEDMDQVRYQLKTIKQGPSEKVTDYGQRVMILLSKLERSYNNNSSLIAVEKFCYQQQEDQEALKQFWYGLRPDIQYLVSIRRPRGLEEAISEAKRIKKRRAYILIWIGIEIYT